MFLIIWYDETVELLLGSQFLQECGAVWRLTSLSVNLLIVFFIDWLIELFGL